MATAETYVRRERLIKAMVKDRALPPLALRVGIMLAAGCFNRTPYAYWSYEGLADALGATKSAVIRAARTLEGRYFRVVKKSGGGRSWRNEYHPIEPGETVTAPSPFDEEERVTVSSRKGDHLVTERVTAPSPERKVRKEKGKGGAKIAPVAPPEFDHLLKAYQAAKGADAGDVEKANREYSAILKAGVSPVRIVQAVRAWAADRAKQDSPPYATSLANFLRQGRWRAFEPDWQGFYRAIVGGPERWDGERELFAKHWRTMMGPDAPLPGQPGSPFPSELVPDSDKSKEAA